MAHLSAENYWLIFFRLKAPKG